MKEIEGWLEEGDSYYYNSAYTKIINVFTKVLKKDSDNQHIINRLGDIFYAVKVYVKALDYFEKAIQLFLNKEEIYKCKLVWMYNKIGLIYRKQKNYYDRIFKGKT